MIYFADKIALVASSKVELEKALNEMGVFLMTINYKKEKK